MIRKVAVGDVMTRQFSYVSPEAHLLACARRMVKDDITSLLLVQNKKLLGLITQTDILWALTKKPGLDLTTVKAIDIAVRKVAVIKPSADLAQAFQKMKRLGFRRLPVLAKGEVVGLLTIKDILRIEPEFYTKTAGLMDIREEAEKRQRLADTAESEGFCDNCGAFADLLAVDSRSLCADCRDELY
ncbi:MAG: CBS domain-containing protein [Nanoarchaeota archaeon]|mgnify:FL=1